MAEQRQRAGPVTGLMGLCLLWAAGLLRADLLPATGAGLRVAPQTLEALLLGLFAILAGGAGLARRARWPRGRALGAAAGAGVGIFVVPAVLTTLSKGVIDDATRVALFALVGTLLVCPVEIPQTAVAGLGFCGMVVAAAAVAAGNCVGVARCREGEVSWLGFGAAAAGVAAVLTAAAGLAAGRVDANAVRLDAWVAADLTALVLLFWLMPRMSAVRMSTRFVIAPLLANLIGLAFLRPGVQWRGWLGLALIAAGSGWLLLAPEVRPEESTLKLDLT